MQKKFNLILMYRLLRLILYFICISSGAPNFPIFPLRPGPQTGMQFGHSYNKQHNVLILFNTINSCTIVIQPLYRHYLTCYSTAILISLQQSYYKNTIAKRLSTSWAVTCRYGNLVTNFSCGSRVLSGGFADVELFHMDGFF